MKSCKKITALLIAVILAFSVLTCIAGAAPAQAVAKETESETITPSSINPDDYTFESIPDPIMTTESSYDISDFVSDYSEEIHDINNDTRGIFDGLKNMFKTFLDFFDNLNENFNAFCDKIFGNKKA